jgi:hypothetical protein
MPQKAKAPTSCELGGALCIDNHLNMVTTLLKYNNAPTESVEPKCK